MPSEGFFRGCTQTRALIALGDAGTLLVGVAGPAFAQFFGFGSPPSSQPRGGGGLGGGGLFGNDFFAPFQQAPEGQAPRRAAPRRIIEDFSRAPPPERRDIVPERNVLVLGDPWRTGSPMVLRMPIPSSRI